MQIILTEEEYKKLQTNRAEFDAQVAEKVCEEAGKLAQELGKLYVSHGGRIDEVFASRVQIILQRYRR